MSQVMCRCKNCNANTIGLKTGLGAGGHIFHLLVIGIGFLLVGPIAFAWAIIYFLFIAVTGNTRCTICGKMAKPL